MGYFTNGSVSGVSNAISGRVDTFANLPAAGTNTGNIYIVEQDTGVVFVNRKRAGLYISDGAVWTRLSENSSFYRTSAGSGSDNRLLKSDGTDGNGAQESGITVDDSNNLSGVGSIDGSVGSIGSAFTSGEALTAGDLVYLDTDGKVWKSFATGTVEEASPVGFAQSTVGAEASVTIKTVGVETGLSGLSSGVIYYLSGTAGAVTSTPPSGAGDNVVKIGISENTTNLDFKPQFIYTKD